MALFVSGGCMAAGGKYNTQARLLTPKIYSILMSRSVCVSQEDCNKKEILYGDHDDSVNFNIYGVHDDLVISEIIGESIAFSAEYSAPVTLSFYVEPKRELLGLKRKFKKPRIKVDINI